MIVFDMESKLDVFSLSTNIHLYCCSPFRYPPFPGTPIADESTLLRAVKSRYESILAPNEHPQPSL